LKSQCRHFFKEHLEPGVTAISLDYDSAFSADAMAVCDKFITDDFGQMMETKHHGPYFAHVHPTETIRNFGHVVAGLKAGMENTSERLFMMFMA